MMQTKAQEASSTVTFTSKVQFWFSQTLKQIYVLSQNKDLPRPVSSPVEGSSLGEGWKKQDKYMVIFPFASKNQFLMTLWLELGAIAHEH